MFKNSLTIRRLKFNPLSIKKLRRIFLFLIKNLKIILFSFLKSIFPLTIRRCIYIRRSKWKYHYHPLNHPKNSRLCLYRLYRVDLELRSWARLGFNCFYQLFKIPKLVLKVLVYVNTRQSSHIQYTWMIATMF